MKKSKNIEKEKQERIQSLINVGDIENSLLYTKDGYIIGYVQVLPVNISLLSKAEQRRKRNLLTEKFNTETEFEFIKFSKSADLSMQLNYLQDLVKEETNPTRKMALLSNIKATSRYSQRGEMVNNQYYYMFKSKYEDEKSVKELLDKINEFVIKLNECEIKANILTNIEILELNNLFCNPTAYTEDIDLDYYVTSFMS